MKRGEGAVEVRVMQARRLVGKLPVRGELGLLDRAFKVQGQSGYEGKRRRMHSRP